jgi:hypothetical protein
LLPSVVASELEQVAADAIRTAFHPTTPGFAGLIDRFLAEREQLLKGPYVSVALPFHQGTGSGKTECFLLPLLEHCRQQQAQGQQGGSAENPSRHPAHQLQTTGLFADPAPRPEPVGARTRSEGGTPPAPANH